MIKIFTTLVVSTFLFINTSFATFLDPCDVLIEAGVIGSAQILCVTDNDPLPLKNLLPASGDVDNFEYQWIYTNNNPNDVSVVWNPLNGATDAEYDPEELTQTTWFRRCARPAGCTVFSAESNIVKIEIKNCTTDCTTLNIQITNLRHESCQGAADGAFDINIIGGVAPYQLFKNGSILNTRSLNGLPQGLYSLAVVDNNGCNTNIAVAILAPAPIELSVVTFSETCRHNDGVIDLTVKGGTAPYQFFWTGNLGKTQNPEGVSAGKYLVQVVDANGCYESLEVDLVLDCQPLVLGFDEGSVENLNDKKINIEWTARNESPGLYVIERSKNNHTFEVLETIEATGENISESQYIIEDTAPLSGYNYYRVCHLAKIDGKMSVTSTVATFLRKTGQSEVVIYPNPVTEWARVEFPEATEEIVTISVVNSLGQVLVVKEIAAGNTSEILDFATYDTGQYFIQIEQTGVENVIHPVVK